MPNTLLIGYGGFGCTCVRNYVADNEVPALLLDVHPPSEELSMYTDFMELASDLKLDESRLRNVLTGYRNIVLVSSLGGESFADAYGVLSNSASTLGISTVSLCTIPYMFETERRERALENLGLLSGDARSMFVLDSQKTISADGPSSDFMSRTCDFISDALDILLPLIENSPFNSYCSEPLYTFAISESLIPVDAVKDCLAHPYFDNSRVAGKVIICTGHDMGEIETEQVESAVTSATGILPEIISGLDYGKDRYLLIIPISFRRNE